jgi:hypothetical protein
MPQLDQDRFIKKAKRLAVQSQNYQAPGTPITEDDVYVVWFAKVLSNWKAMVSTDAIEGVYYEVTYNGLRNESYVDIYAKVANYHVSDDAIVPPHFLRSV